MRIGRGRPRTAHRGRGSRPVLVSVAALTLLAALTTATPGLAAPSAPSASTGPGVPAAEQPRALSARERQAAEPMPLQELTSAGGVGRLYTLDLAESRAAQNGSDMKRSPRQTAFLPRGKFEGSTPMYRLKPAADAKAWLYTAAKQERDELLAKGWVDEGVSGHLATEPGAGREPLLRFSNGKEWRLALESRADALKQAGYQVDGRLGYAWKKNVRAGALYFGMFNDVGGKGVMDGTEKYYGRKGDWWGGVRDFHDGTHYATDNWPDEDFTNLEPSIGYYDDSRPETAEKHISQATSAGLDFFSFYWYWNPADKQESVARKSMDAFLKAKNREQIDFSAAICAHPWGGLGIPTDQFGDVSRVLVDKYLSQDNALRANDGRKILEICDARGIGKVDDDSGADPAKVAQFVTTVRERAQDKLGEQIYVVVNQGSYDPSDLPAADADAAYCTTDGPAVEAQSYQKYLEGQRASFDQAPGAFGRCAMSDFDERPRYPVSIPNVDEIRWMPDQSLDGYRQALGNVAADMAESERPPEIDNFAYLYAWNEWHEGGILEPNTRDGCAYLDAVREELDLTDGSGCVASP